MFNFIKNKLQKIFSHVTSKLGTFFSRSVIDESALNELEIVLISSDVGVTTSRSIIAQLKQKIGNNITQGEQLKKEMHTILCNILNNNNTPNITNNQIFLFVGINGSGKTTSIGKLAHFYTQQGKKVLLAAADTFRAAAPEQLTEWATKTNCDIIRGKEGQDPTSVVFQACEKFKNEHYDILIIDTAGRLQTKINLMNELAKIKRAVTKQLPTMPLATLLTIDGMLGQNSFEQAKLFKESTDVNGIVLTKMDGTGKGGIVFAIAQELSIPIALITYGEQYDQLKPFNAQEYVTELLG
jgi:fused signal recognition particle receptor